MTDTVILVHGGIWDPGMDGARFWTAPGVTGALADAGFDVLAPDRLPLAPSWEAEAEHLAPVLAAHPGAVVVGASNGCTVAVRLALVYPELIRKLILAWPATAGDPRVDAMTREGMARRGAADGVADLLLSGGVLRGVADAELASVAPPVAVLRAVPVNPFHQHGTVEAILGLLPSAVEIGPGCPEPPRPEFAPHLPDLVRALAEFCRR